MKIIEKAKKSYDTICATVATARNALESLELPKQVIDDFCDHNKIHVSVPLFPIPTIRPLTKEEKRQVNRLEKENGVKVIHAIMKATKCGQVLVSYICINKCAEFDEKAIFVCPVADDGLRYFKALCITLDPTKEIPKNPYLGPEAIELIRINCRPCLVMCE